MARPGLGQPKGMLPFIHAFIQSFSQSFSQQISRPISNGPYLPVSFLKFFVRIKITLNCQTYQVDEQTLFPPKLTGKMVIQYLSWYW
jgi:hypothetical protein